MSTDRRKFLGLAAAGVASEVVPSFPLARTPAGNRVEAVAFDAFAIFDPRPISALAERLFPGKGTELANAWRTRQFEYQWLRALCGRYADFWQATEDALVFSGELLKLELTRDRVAQLMDAHLALAAWPDVSPALKALEAAGLRLAFVSNATPRILEGGIKSSRLDGVFEHVLSTDAVQTFKPDPRAYQLALDAFRLAREQILFVPFAGWDAAGAKSFGYPTFWVNRLGLPRERLGVVPDAIGKDLGDLLAFLGA